MTDRIVLIKGWRIPYALAVPFTALVAYLSRPQDNLKRPFIGTLWAVSCWIFAIMRDIWRTDSRAFIYPTSTATPTIVM